MGDQGRVTKAVHHGILLWLIVVASTVTISVVALQGRYHEFLPHALGFVLAFAVVATRSLACRYKDLTTLVLALFAGSFGLWFEGVYRECGNLAAGWSEAGVLPTWAGEPAAGPLAVLLGGLIAGVLLYVSTGWSRVAQMTGLGTVLAAGLVLLPGSVFGTVFESPEYFGPAVAAVTWQSFVSLGLIWWAVEVNRRLAQHGCPYCGADLRGVASPTCPSCGKVPSAAGPSYEDGADEHARVNRALREYYEARRSAPERPALPGAARRAS